jgi:TLC domain
MSLVTTVAAFAAHCAVLVRNHASPLGRYLLIYALVHLFFEVIGPRMPLLNRVYRGLDPAGKLSQRAINKDIRTKAICILMAIAVVALCIKGLLTSEGNALISQPHGSTPLSMELVYISVAHFTWDLFVCWADKEPWLFWVHGLASFFTFLVALQPISQYMAQVVLLQEASTVLV